MMPPPVIIDKSTKKLILRHFTIIRCRQLEEGTSGQNSEEIIESQYAHIALYSSPRMQGLKLLNIEVNLPELNI
jgi:hypothetical protein